MRSSWVIQFLVVVWYVKELLAPHFIRKLCKNSTGSEAHAVLLNVMSKGLLKNLECLEAMVGRFTPVSNDTSCFVPLLRSKQSTAGTMLMILLYALAVLACRSALLSILRGIVKFNSL